MRLFQSPPSSERSHLFCRSGSSLSLGALHAACKVLRCLGAFIPTTTFIRAMTSLLQIRQFAHLRSTTCSLQGLSSTQRSTQAAPSRDLTLGVKEQKKGTPKDYQSQGLQSPPGKTELRGTRRWRFCRRWGRAFNPELYSEEEG